MSGNSEVHPEQDTRRAVRLVIAGKVQGVWFRAWAVKQATTLGLDGWVRNRSTGVVEALAVGPPEAVETFIRACQKGPPSARVSSIEVHTAQGITARGFTQKPTV